jgi:hypothetical protein
MKSMLALAKRRSSSFAPRLYIITVTAINPSMSAGIAKCRALSIILQEYSFVFKNDVDIYLRSILLFTTFFM